MTLAHPRTASMVIAVGNICFTGAKKTSAMRRGRAPWIKPPMNAEMKIQTPGVLTQLKLTVAGLGPE